jgi:hypothetical protein
MWDSFFHVDYAGSGLQTVIVQIITKPLPTHHHEIRLCRYFDIVRLVLPRVLCGCWRMRRFVTLVDHRSPVSSICRLPYNAMLAPGCVVHQPPANYIACRSFLFPPPVCIKVLDDVKAMLGKEKANNKPAIEAALGEYCEKTTLSNREKKICYYM